MRAFEFVEHTADVGIRARGNSLAELLAACAEGMFSILIKGGQVREAAAVEVAIEAEDAEELAHGWLRELLFLFSADGFVLARCEVHEAAPTRVRATCHGEPFDPARHRGGAEIKAVTYHGFKVEPSPDGWTAEVLFDV